MASLKIFVSFEFDKDGDLKGNFFEQAKRHTKHHIKNSSLNEAYPTGTWKAKARAEICKCDAVIVLVGPDTHNAQGVKTEIDIARELNKPIVQIVPQSWPYSGVPSLKDSIRWKWKRINKCLDKISPRKQRG